jgi:hypothetical protein
MDAMERSRVIESRWMALFYIVLCLGLHFGDSNPVEEASLLEVSPRPAARTEI